MNINMSGQQFDKLTELCRNTSQEFGGTMNTIVMDDDVCVVDNGIILDSSELIESASPRFIKYNPEEYITMVVYDIGFSNSPVYIRFHTHPSETALPSPSQADAELLKRVQEISTKLRKTTPYGEVTVIEEIITYSEIAFYTYDLEADKATRLPLFVDGTEKIPDFEKSTFQRCKEGFLKGLSKVKNKQSKL